MSRWEVPIDSGSNYDFIVGTKTRMLWLVADGGEMCGCKEPAGGQVLSVINLKHVDCPERHATQHGEAAPRVPKVHELRGAAHGLQLVRGLAEEVNDPPVEVTAVGLVLVSRLLRPCRG